MCIHLYVDALDELLRYGSTDLKVCGYDFYTRILKNKCN